MTPQELAHNAFVQFILHTENITWSRFYNYLMAMTFLILAWTTLYVAEGTIPMRQVILISMAVIGFLSGFFWSALGYRGRSFLHMHMEKGAELEADASWQDCNLKPITLSVNLRDELPFRPIGSRFILIVMPILISILYAILFFASVCR